MKLGLQIINFDWPGTPANTAAHLAQMAQTAEAVGFASLWMMDHFYQIPDDGVQIDSPMPEANVTLAYAAAVTRTIKLGVLVNGVVYREPAMLVKIASTLDVLSGGRTYLGLGAAWYEEEARGLGFPFPPAAERLARLEETLQIIHKLWGNSRHPYEGRYYRLAQPINSPQPLAQPHPPILVGGGGETKTLRLVAEYADACNLYASLGPEELTRKLDVLKYHCDATGRDYNSIERTALGRVNLGKSTPAEIVKWCRELAKVGIQHLIITLADDAALTPMEILGRDVIPAIAEY
jgi:F420-dependent oxidoreductase-like protein